MFDEEDAELLKKMRKYASKKKKDFYTVINSKNLTEKEMDDLFLSS